MADSILLLAWATVFTQSGQPTLVGRVTGALILVALSLVSTVLSCFWTAGGYRQAKFIALNMHSVITLEDCLSHEMLRVTRPVFQLQRGKTDVLVSDRLAEDLVAAGKSDYIQERSRLKYWHVELRGPT